MKFLEVIELRAAGNQLRLLKPELDSLINTLNKETRHGTINVYGNLTVETDFSIHLHYESQKTDISGSPLGQHLVSVLKEFGLINHTLWVEEYIS
jgi:hypothetical protein